MSQGNFVWYELMTPDTAAAAEFYGDVVGWRAETSPMPGMDYTLFKVGEARAAGLMVLGQMAKDRGVPPCWTGYVAADDVDAMAEAFKAAGGAIQHGPDDIPGIGRFAVVADPQGAVICLFKGTETDWQPPLPPGTPGAIGWHELFTSDLEAAKAFYTGKFGWTLGEAMPMGEMGDYQIFNIGGHMAGGMMKRPPDMPASFWGFYFNVADLDAALEKAKAKGAKVLNGPMDVPGGGRIAQCMDPQNAYFCLSQPGHN